MSAPLRTSERTRCPICGSQGDTVLSNLTDRQYAAPGIWGIRRCAAEKCSCLWLDPAPAEADIHLLYAGYYTHDRAAGRRPGTRSPRLPRALYEQAQRAHLTAHLGYPSTVSRTVDTILDRALGCWPGRHGYARDLVMHLPFQPQGKVLDVGCGDGDRLARLASMGWAAEGIEIDPKAVAAARGRHLKVHHGDLSRKGTAGELAMPLGGYDAVTLRHVIEHAVDTASLLEACHDLLRPGGRIALITPNAHSALFKRYRRDWCGLDLPRHLVVFSRAALTRVLEQAGFTDIDVASSSNGANVAAAAAAALRSSQRFSLTSPTPTWRRMYAEAVQVLSALRERADPGSGEELIALATKPAPMTDRNS